MTDQTMEPVAPSEENQTPGSILGQSEPVANDDSGSPDTPVGAPESVDGYEVNIDGFNYDEFKAIPENQEFLERAREAGLDSKSLSFLLAEYNQLVPNLAQQNQHLDNEACVTAMNEVWGSETNTNFGYARAAADNAIQNGILTEEEVNSPDFGNNPLVLKMAAYFGEQLGEDLPPSNTQQSSAVDVQSLMTSEAYLNPSHADHNRVYAQVQKAYEKQSN